MHITLDELWYRWDPKTQEKIFQNHPKKSSIEFFHKFWYLDFSICFQTDNTSIYCSTILMQKLIFQKSSQKDHINIARKCVFTDFPFAVICCATNLACSDKNSQWNSKASCLNHAVKIEWIFKISKTWIH